MPNLEKYRVWETPPFYHHTYVTSYTHKLNTVVKLNYTKFLNNAHLPLTRRFVYITGPRQAAGMDFLKRKKPFQLTRKSQQIATTTQVNKTDVVIPERLINKFIFYLYTEKIRHKNVLHLLCKILVHEIICGHHISLMRFPNNQFI